MKKQTKAINSCLKERIQVCKTLHELDDATEYSSYTFSDVVSSLVFKQRQISQSDEDGMVGSSTLSCRQQILDCYHLKQRCEEEVEILGNEMKNAVKFYVNDIRNLQSVKEDDYSVGDIACVKKEVELQKVRLAILASTFQQFTDVQKLISDELHLPYEISNGTISENDSDSAEEDVNDDSDHDDRDDDNTDLA